MDIQENVSLRQHSTMRLGGTARYLCYITARAEIAPAVAWAEERELPVIMIGVGSNIIWRDEGFPGLVIVNQIPGFETYQIDDHNVYVTIGAGEIWDSVVQRTVDIGCSGIEPLSLIPGTAGATPIQNVGAYGREIKDVLVTVEAYDRKAKQLVNLRADECDFSYRMSRFKSNDKGRFFISALTLHVTKTNPQPPFYAAVQQYLEAHHITNITPATIREAVIAIRTAKLPDPDIVANNGSFFFNPIVDQAKLTQLQAAYPDLPYWLQDGGLTKLSAAWLIEQAGFKDIHDGTTGMATWSQQPLVLVNERAEHTANLLQFRDKIIATVRQKFGVTLKQEPELV